MSEQPGIRFPALPSRDELVTRFLPIATWLPAYPAEWRRQDLIAAITSWGVMVPVAMAYAGLAGVPPEYGLVTAFAALTAYAVFGTSRHVKVTTSSTMAIMSAAVVAPLAGGDPDQYLALSAALALVVGAILVVAGVVRLGFINRGPNLDIWSYDRRSGETRRLTDHPADVWDPALTPDGRSLLWSSSRSGNFEVWMADADGAHPRQVTRDGVDAENPTATRDGQWIVYSSQGAPGRVGIWKVRPDGTDATLLVRDVVLPEVSPDGTRVLFQTNRSPGLAVVGVALVADGRILPFEIRIAVNKPPPPILGRARWMPDGRAIAFVGQDEQGATGVFVQPFVPGEDTTARRVALAGFHPDRLTESFGVAPSGKGLVLAEWEKRSTVMATTGLPR